MSKDPTLLEHELFNEKTSTELVALLNQTLADTLDLAYQTRQAHWNVKGPNHDCLHLLFGQLYLQLGITMDDLAERARALGSSDLSTIRAAGNAFHLEEYPLEAKQRIGNVNDLVDRYSDYTSRVRQSIRKAEELGDQDTADLYTSVSCAMDKALRLLTASQED